MTTVSRCFIGPPKKVIRLSLIFYSNVEFGPTRQIWETIRPYIWQPLTAIEKLFPNFYTCFEIQMFIICG
uniref:Ovule protein n=1 Tax=Romanomermis culicivorax TaxID=13658 RepID=A0A915HMV9_ROMCU